MADMELLLVYAWWHSLCVQEKGEGFCHGIHGRTRKNEKKGTVLPRNPRKNTNKDSLRKEKSFLSFPFVFFSGFRGKKISKSFLSVFFRGFRGQKTKPACSPL